MCLLFQHTATRRWLHYFKINQQSKTGVSTHSHPKVAALIFFAFCRPVRSFNTQPPEGGCIQHLIDRSGLDIVSTHSHPKVAAPTNTIKNAPMTKFQHTATRRWLHFSLENMTDKERSFNTQPPEGGCKARINRAYLLTQFQHTATRRWLLRKVVILRFLK